MRFALEQHNATDFDTKTIIEKFNNFVPHAAVKIVTFSDGK